MLSSKFRFDKVFESVNPQVDLIIAMFFAKLDDIFISVSGNKEIKKILSHTQFSAEIDNSIIEIVHFEQRQ